MSEELTCNCSAPTEAEPGEAEAFVVDQIELITNGFAEGDYSKIEEARGALIAALRSTPNAVSKGIDTIDPPAVAVDDDELVERLLAIESSASDFVGDPNPLYTTCWHRNPDGPAAVTRLQSLLASVRAKNEALREGAEWFEEYAKQHEAKARAANPGGSSRSASGEAQDRWEKATTNALRAKSLRAALSDQQGGE